MNNKELQQDELLGAVRLGSKWRYFAGTLAEWILDYASYDPDYDPANWTYIYRNNLLRVDETLANEFCDAMKEHEFIPEDIRHLVDKKGADKIPLAIVIDFDNLVFINGFYDLALEEYAPKWWTNYFGNPYEYVPPEVRDIWRL